jgi:3-hydroxybutyryl-CoA dehydrogenase
MIDVKRIGVVGAGQMGRGITQVCVQAGYQVVLLDVSTALVDAGVERMTRDLDRLVEKGKLPAEDRDTALGRLTKAEGMTDLADCDFVIEAATENIELKLGLFQELDRAMRKAAILASNTSSIPLSRLAGSTQRPEQVIGMHFMNPVPLMKLVEIILALQTSDQTYQLTQELATALGKTSITSKDMPGFIVNRMLLPLINEACFALQEGQGSVEDIDTGAKLGLNHPMGPLELADLIGLDTCLSIAEVLQREFGDDKYRPATILRNYVAAGWLGRKSGKGFYDYSRK